jgi:uncharacterized repeat protein (TIGR01451 family)
MKKIYIGFALLAFAFSNAQIINFPDANLKNALVNTLCVNTDLDPEGEIDADTNNDGEIDVTEALAVEDLYLQSQNISSLEGIQYFSNLEELQCVFNNLATIDVSMLENLVALSCGANQLTSIAVHQNLQRLGCGQNHLSTLPTNMTLLLALSCPDNEFTVLDCSTMLSLSNIDCNDNQISQFILPPHASSVFCINNQLTALDVSNYEDLVMLMCGHNNLTSLVVPDDLGYLDCSYNMLTALEVPNVAMHTLNVSYNQLTDLDLQGTSVSQTLNISGNPYTSVTVYGSCSEFYCSDTQLGSLIMRGKGIDISSISDNPNLEYINFRNGIEDGPCDDFPDCPSTIFSLDNNPALHSICTDSHDGSLVNYATNLYPDLVFTSYCEFTPSDGYNTITGQVRYDGNANGCDTADIGYPNLRLTLTSDVMSIALGTGYTNASGAYNLYTGDAFGSFNLTIAPEFENNYFTSDPASFTTAFTSLGNNLPLDFCITPNGIHPDLEISVMPTDAARPGFDANYKITCKNKGTQTQSGDVTLNFAGAILDYISANPAVDSQTTDSLTWNFTNLVPFESREIMFTVNVNSSLETPPVNNDDVLDFSAVVTSAQTDETPIDNTARLSQTVVGSYDPNDKAVAEGVFISPAQLGDYLHYTVRFQNTGTFAAQNVVVKDILAANFDLASLQLIGASHTHRTRLVNNVLEFFFENIQLPPALENEPASHGYVSFKIKPKNTVVLGNTLENTGEIYFDFNAPVVTNTVATAVAPLAMKTFGKDLFTIFPNPASTLLNIKSDAKITAVEIANHLGQTVLKSNNTTVDVSGLASGVYFVKAHSAQGNATQKFIKI